MCLYVYVWFCILEGNSSSSSNNLGLESINVITNALGSRSVNLREMMRRATAAVRSSGKGTVFVNFCFYTAVIRHTKNNFLFKNSLVCMQNIQTALFHSVKM